jgi:hypothetical protein
MAELREPCSSCGGKVVTTDWNTRFCLEMNRQVCKICHVHLGARNLSAGDCDRCRDEGDMIALGNG